MITIRVNDIDIDKNDDDDDDDEYIIHTTINYDCKTNTIRHRCDSTCGGVVTE